MRKHLNWFVGTEGLPISILKNFFRTLNKKLKFLCYLIQPVVSVVSRSCQEWFVKADFCKALGK